MIVYRVVLTDQVIINNKGINSFNYDKNEYLHFFILPENAEIFQTRNYKNNNINSIIFKCDIPYNLLEFGIGLYGWYYHIKMVPFLEVRIKQENFKPTFIKDISNFVKFEWKNTEIFKRYLINCIYNQNAFTYLDKNNYKIKLNNKFNFLHYFNKNDLEKEKIFVKDYPYEESLNNLKIKNLSIIKRILISIKENIEMLNETESAFIDIKYNEKKYQK